MDESEGESVGVSAWSSQGTKERGEESHGAAVTMLRSEDGERSMLN